MKKQFGLFSISIKLIVLLMLFSPFSFAVTETGLLSYYSFDGHANDESENQHHGQVFGEPMLVSDRFGNVNSAYYFDGVDDFIWIPEAQQSQHLTASIWVKTTEEEYCNAYSQGIIDAGSYDLRSHTCETWATVLYGESFNDTIQFIGGYWPEPGVDRWHHLAMTYDGWRLRVYLNSQIVFDETISAESPQAIYYGDSFNGIAVGQDHAREGRFFQGAIDDFRLYSRALTQNEINGLYQEGNALDCRTRSAWNLDPDDFENRQIFLACEAGYTVVGGGAECYDYANWYGRLTKSMPFGNGWSATCMRYDYNGTENNEGAQMIKSMYVRCCR